MNRDETAALFDQQAPGYDSQWERMAPVRDSLYFLVEAVFASIRADAHVLGVGVGTGMELAHLARRFPRWRFTAVEPSRAMLERCRQRAVHEGFAARCTFHHGFLDSLAGDVLHDAATCFLVSQFLTETTARAAFFGEIGTRLRPGGILVNADLASDTGSIEYETLLPMWLNRMSSAGVPPEALARARAAYAKDVAVLPPTQIQSLIASAGFSAPTQFYQAGLLHAWCAARTTRAAA
jgi:tRNA (cmo5U34)-methyltransferase